MRGRSCQFPSLPTFRQGAAGIRFGGRCGFFARRLAGGPPPGGTGDHGPGREGTAQAIISLEDEFVCRYGSSPAGHLRRRHAGASDDVASSRTRGGLSICPTPGRAICPSAAEIRPASPLPARRTPELHGRAPDTPGVSPAPERIRRDSQGQKAQNAYSPQ